MTDTLVRKDLYGQQIGKGFLPEVHCTVGAPKESFAKFTRAEPGREGKDKVGGLWRPAELGLRPTYESEAMKRFLEGKYTKG